MKETPRASPPRPRTPVAVWVAAVCMASLAAFLTFLAATHREHATEPTPLGRPVPLPPIAQRPQPAPKPEPQRLVRREPSPPKVEHYCLTLNADIAPAAVRIDGSAPIGLPLESYPVAPGPHELVVFGHHRSRKLHVTEAVTRAPCVAQTILLARRSR